MSRQRMVDGFSIFLVRCLLIKEVKMKKLFMMGFAAGLIGGLSLGLAMHGIWLEKRG